MPIGFAFLVIGGGAGWVTRQEIKVSETRALIDQGANKFDLIENRLIDISQRLGRIEGQLERKR